MKMTYDHTVDALYIELVDKSRISTRQINESFILDLDEHEQVVGIEILRVRKSGIDPLTFVMEHLPSQNEVEPPSAEQIKANRAVIIEARKRQKSAQNT